MHAGLLDVLHDRADDGALAVADGVDVDLDRVVDEAVDERSLLHRAGPQRLVVVADAHLAAAEHVARPHQHRIPDPVRDLDGLVGVGGDPPVRCAQIELGEDAAEPLAILGDVDCGERRPEDLHAGLLEPAGEPQRCLAAELDDDSDGLLALDHLEHVLDGERLEVEPVGRVGVGRDRLRVAVDHDRVVAERAERLDGADAAVVELDALSDPVRPGAEDDDGRPRRRLELVLLLVGRVEVRRLGLDLGGAAVDGFEHRPDACGQPQPPRRRLVGACQLSDARVGQSELLQPPPLGLDERLERRALQHPLGVGDPLPLVEEPEVHRRLGGERGRIFAGGQPALDRVEAVPLGFGHRAGRARAAVELARPHRLPPRLGERAPDPHHLADRLHLRGQAGVGAGELLECEPGQLDDDVVERRLERGRCRARYVVRDLVERVADRELRGDLGDRIARRL